MKKQELVPRLYVISKQAAFPTNAVTQTFGIVGIRGSGKTNTAIAMAEEMLKRKVQITVIDPTDVWYGLRSSGDGKDPAFPITVLGGEHGDLPLFDSNGATIAEFVVQHGASVILSLRHLSIRGQKIFARDFAERLYDLKGKPKYRTPIHLFVDEADEFIPQKIQHGEERMFGAFDRLVRRGRSSGIGMTMITQRPQVVNKDTLSQVETLICHRLIHKLDRKAVLDGWVSGHDIKGQADKFMESLSSLGRGEAWVWSPSWLDMFVKTQVRARETFDSSFTPEIGEAPKIEFKMSPVYLDELKKALQDTLEKAKQDDPAELRRQISILEKELKTVRAQPATAAKIVEKLIPVFEPALVEQMKKIASDVSIVNISSNEILKQVQAQIDAAMKSCEAAARSIAPAEIGKLREPANRPHVSKLLQAGTGNNAAGIAFLNSQLEITDTDFSRSQVKLIESLARAEAIGRRPISRTWLAFMSGVSPNSSGFEKNLSTLRTGGFVEYGAGSTVALTDRGRSVAPRVQVPLTTGEMVESVCALLSSPQAELLRILVQARGRALSRETLATAAGVSWQSSGFEKNVSTLMSRELATRPQPGYVQVAEWLFV